MLLAEEAEIDEETGQPRFLADRTWERPSGQQTSRLEKRRQAMRRLGVPEHLIDAEIAKQDAAREKLLQEAGVKRRP